jgi:hypothetical protein
MVSKWLTGVDSVPKTVTSGRSAARTRGALAQEGPGRSFFSLLRANGAALRARYDAGRAKYFCAKRLTQFQVILPVVPSLSRARVQKAVAREATQFAPRGGAQAIPVAFVMRMDGFRFALHVHPGAPRPPDISPFGRLPCHKDEWQIPQASKSSPINVNRASGAPASPRAGDPTPARPCAALSPRTIALRRKTPGNRRSARSRISAPTRPQPRSRMKYPPSVRRAATALAAGSTCLIRPPRSFGLCRRRSCRAADKSCGREPAA